mgnify:CR=1 FL=1
MSFNCMLFVEIMSKRKIYLYSVLICLVFFIWIFSDSNEKNEDLSERVKIALREVGNQLLLSDNDSISLVLPIIELEKFKYKLSFQNQLSFEPTNLTSIIKSSFQKAELPNYYRVEVKQCSDNEVAYSYQMSAEKEDTIMLVGADPELFCELNGEFVSAHTMVQGTKQELHFVDKGAIQLDGVAEGTTHWQTILKAFYTPFIQKVEEGKKRIKSLKVAIPTGEHCPKCDSELLLRKGRYGTLITCSN